MPGRKGPPRTIPLNDFGKRIRPLITARFPSREAFLREVAVSAATLHRYETTDRRPTGRTLLRMSDVLGVTPAHLLTGRTDTEHLTTHGYGDLFDHARALAAHLLSKHMGWRAIPLADRLFLHQLVALHPIVATLSVARHVDDRLLPARAEVRPGRLAPRIDSEEAQDALLFLLAPRAGTTDHLVVESVSRQWRWELMTLLASRPDLSEVFAELPTPGPIGADPWRE